MIAISEIVLNNLSDDVLRSMQNELVAKVEALRADDIAPSRGVVIAIKEINDILNRRLERENEKGIRKW